jgi:hypothetical protein
VLFKFYLKIKIISFSSVAFLQCGAFIRVKNFKNVKKTINLDMVVYRQKGKKVL